MSSKEILALIEQFEGAFDTYQQSLQKNNEEIIQHLSLTWKNMQSEQTEIEKLEDTIHKQNSEITELKIKSEELDKKIIEKKEKRDELTTKITELNKDLETATDELKQPQFELANLVSKIDSLNEKITTKESEKIKLDQIKLDNEQRENELKTTFSKEKLEELDNKLSQLKSDNFFVSFLMKYSDEEIPEVEIVATIMQKGSCKLDDLKKKLDVPPIMAVRTIKQLAVKGIINLDETNNTVSML
ncbi:hypothetical protein ES706_03836 [subsurface metagenome]